MKKEDIRYIIVFILLIVSILYLVVYNVNKQNKTKSIDRKIEYVFDNMTKEEVDNYVNELFTNGINLLNNKAFTFDKETYSIDNYIHLKRINNFSLVYNTFSTKEIDNFISIKNIIINKDDYYMDFDNYKSNSEYIGSIIKMLDYKDNYANFESTNYFCKDYEYIGLMSDKPDCEYREVITSFKIIYESNVLRLNSVEEINNIIK